MAWWQAIILGLVEGITEYLPVSSTGHLILAQRMLGIGSDEAADSYAICIQGGAILAVLGLYWRRVAQMGRGGLGAVGIGQGDREGLRLGVNILAAFMPAAVIGLLLESWIEENLFGLWTIVAAWFVGGVAILAVARWRRRTRLEAGRPGRELADMTWLMAVGIGLIQCIAMWPGVSRSLVTIVGGILVGLSLTAAVEFSFLLGVVTLMAATVYKAQSAGTVMVEAYGWLSIILGTVAAWISAALAIEFLLTYLKRHGLSIFGWYRIGLAVVVAALILTGIMREEPVADPRGTPVPHSTFAPAAADHSE